MGTTAWLTVAELDDPEAETGPEAIAWASWVLWALTGRKYGGYRRVTERYSCPCDCAVSSRAAAFALTGSQFQPLPWLMNGQVYLPNPCGPCGQQHPMRLRGLPIRDIYAVTAGSRVLEPVEWETHDNVVLAASPGTNWSACNRVTVTYTYGAQPPAAGKRAARALANELVLAVTDPGRCALPDRVTSVSRLGVSFTILDPQQFLEEGRLGIYEVDAFIRSVNPSGAQMPPRVWSPDRPRGVRVRGGTGVTYATPTYSTSDLTIEQGSDWTHAWLVRFDGIPITPLWTAQAQVRATIDSEDTLYEWVTGAGAEINVDGVLSIAVADEVSTDWEWTLGVYDVEVTSPAGLRKRIAQGNISVSREVTR